MARALSHIDVQHSRFFIGSALPDSNLSLGRIWEGLVPARQEGTVVFHIPKDRFDTEAGNHIELSELMQQELMPHG